MISSKKRWQDGGCCGANGAVRSRIGRIRRRRPRFRKKVRVGLGIGVAVCIGGSDGGYRPPKGIGVLRVVERDNGVRQGEIHQRKQPRSLCGGQIVAQNRHLSNLVSVYLDSS